MSLPLLTFHTSSPEQEVLLGLHARVLLIQWLHADRQLTDNFPAPQVGNHCEFHVPFLFFSCRKQFYHSKRDFSKFCESGLHQTEDFSILPLNFVDTVIGKVFRKSVSSYIGMHILVKDNADCLGFFLVDIQHTFSNLYP